MSEGGEFLTLYFGPTVEKFVLSKANVVLMYGPRGEGKSVGGMAAMIYHAQRQIARPVKWAVVRDTWVNVERTVLETIRDGVREGWWDAEFRRGGEQVLINGDLLRLYCFGMDTLADASRFQGLELAGLWIDEAAPAMEFSGGVPASVLQMAISSMRQRGVDQWRAQITENAPDDDHWTMRLRDYVGEPITVETFAIRRGENEHLTEERRQAIWAGFKGRPDFQARFGLGEPSAYIAGEPLIPHFSRKVHVAKEALGPWRELPIVRCWDAGTGDLHPAVVYLQCHKRMLKILASRTDENIGITEFIKRHVVTLQNQYEWLPSQPTRGDGFGRGSSAGFEFRDIGDAAGLVKSGVSSELSVAKQIQAMLNTAYEPAPVAWNDRLQALDAAFRRLVGKDADGQEIGWVQIDPEGNDMLIRALAGRCHYPRDESTGRIIGTLEALKRVSGQFMHLVMALGYGLSVLAPAESWVRRPPEPWTKPVRPPPSWLSA